MLFNLKILFCVLFFPFLVQAQTASTCQPSTQLLDVYDWDIKQVAINYLYESNHPDTATVEIPSFWQQRVARGLMAILESNLPPADSIFNYYCVKEYKYTIKSSILLDLDLQVPWARNLYNYIIPTGNPYIDSLLTRHDLYVHRIFDPSGVNLRTSGDSMWNTKQLINAFVGVPGISSVEEDRRIGDGSRITYFENNGTQYYTFYYRWGDCFSGCMCWRKWEFEVNAACHVTYWGTKQYTLTSCMGDNFIPRCSTFIKNQRPPSPKMGLTLYPNPSSGTINIQSDAGDLETIHIFALDGRLIHYETPNTSEISLMLPKDWQTGVYIVQVQVKDQLYYDKIVVQR